VEGTVQVVQWRGGTQALCGVQDPGEEGRGVGEGQEEGDGALTGLSNGFPVSDAVPRCRGVPRTRMRTIFTGGALIALPCRSRSSLPSGKRVKAVDWLDWLSALGALLAACAPSLGAHFHALLYAAEAIRGDNFRVLPSKYFGPFTKGTTLPIPYGFSTYPAGYAVPWNSSLDDSARPQATSILQTPCAPQSPGTTPWHSTRQHNELAGTPILYSSTFRPKTSETSLENLLTAAARPSKAVRPTESAIRN